MQLRGQGPGVHGRQSEGSNLSLQLLQMVFVCVCVCQWVSYSAHNDCAKVTSQSSIFLPTQMLLFGAHDSVLRVNVSFV